MVVLCFMVSCQDEILDNGSSQELSTNLIFDDDSIVLGDHIDDPYNIKNMEKAYTNLKSTNSETPNVEILPTHKYMRFLPQDEEEWDILKSDTAIVLYDFPLDYEIQDTGTFYHDPSLPDSAITWQYCVLPIDYKVPDIECELIYEVFIPDESDSTNLKYASISSDFFNELEYESYRLTNNLSSNDNAQKSTSGLWSQWRPKGTIKVWDDVIDDYIPLVQVCVHARWCTRIETDLTDEDGYFETGKFRNSVNYAIKWERADYDIRNGNLIQAWYNGPKQKGDWNLNIGEGGKSIMYATMHRAAYKQFYGDNLDIRRPTTNGKTKLCYIDENGTGVCWGDWIDYGILPDIKVYGKSKGVYKPTDQIFATTTHELGHLSHWHLIGIDNYALTGEKIYESWADAVKWALTNDEYHTLGSKLNNSDAKNYECTYSTQLDWPKVDQKEYLPIFIDLIDDINQRVKHGGSALYPNDLISGYTLSYIQDNILKKSRGYSSLRDQVKAHKISEVTDADIDELFLLYWEN